MEQKTELLRNSFLDLHSYIGVIDVRDIELGYIYFVPENVVGVSEDLGGEPLGSVPPPF